MMRRDPEMFGSERRRIVVTAALLGVLTLVLLWPGIGSRVFGGDHQQNSYLAYNIIHHGEFHFRPDVAEILERGGSLSLYMRREPGYPLYLAALFVTVPEFYSLNIDCPLSWRCEAGYPLRQRVQQVDAVLSALTMAAMFLVVYALVGSWALAVAAALLFMILMPVNLLGNLLVGLLLLGHAGLMLRMWRKPWVVTGVLSGLAVGGLVLIEAVFQYWLLVLTVVWIVGLWRAGERRRELVSAFAAMLLVALVISLPWMVRNWVRGGVFSIAGRSGETIAVRAEYASMLSWAEVLGTFAFYLPLADIPYGDDIRAFAMDKLEPANFGYARIDPENEEEGLYRRAQHAYFTQWDPEGVQGGAVAARADTLEGPGWREGSPQVRDAAIARAGLELIGENWLKHAVLSLAFTERGMDYRCRDYNAAWNTYGVGVKVPLKMMWKVMCAMGKGISFLFLPALGMMLVLAWRRRDLGLAFLLLPVAYFYGFHAVATRFIPRYAEPLVPLFVVILALALAEVWLWAQSRRLT